MPAGLISELFHAVTVGFETIFHMPDDLNYSQTGMLFGSELMLTAMNGSKFGDPKVQQDFTVYARQCVIPDTRIGVQSWADLAKAPNIWDVLDAHQSPIRGFNYKGNFQTCAEIYPKLKQEILGDSSLGQMIREMATKVFGRSGLDEAQAVIKLQAALPNAYNYFTQGTGSSAGDIIMQNTLINALKDAPSDYASFSNSTSAVMNYSYAVQQQRLTMANHNSGHMAMYTLPMTQLFIFLFFCVDRCSTKVDSDGVHILGREFWGHCRSGCPIDLHGVTIAAVAGWFYCHQIIAKLRMLINDRGH